MCRITRVFTRLDSHVGDGVRKCSLERMPTSLAPSRAPSTHPPSPTPGNLHAACTVPSTPPLSLLPGKYRTTLGLLLLLAQFLTAII